MVTGLVAAGVAEGGGVLVPGNTTGQGLVFRTAMWKMVHTWLFSTRTGPGQPSCPLACRHLDTRDSL